MSVHYVHSLILLDIISYCLSIGLPQWTLSIAHLDIIILPPLFFSLANVSGQISHCYRNATLQPNYMHSDILHRILNAILLIL